MRLGWQWWEPFATSVKPGSATGLCLMIRVGAGGEKRKKKRPIWRRLQCNAEFVLYMIRRERGERERESVRSDTGLSQSKVLVSTCVCVCATRGGLH